MSCTKRHAHVLRVEAYELLFMIQSLYNIHIESAIEAAYDSGYENGKDSEAGRLPAYG